MKLTVTDVIECLRDKGGYFHQIGVSNQYRLFSPEDIALGYFTIPTYNAFVMRFASKIEFVTMGGKRRTQWRQANV